MTKENKQRLIDLFLERSRERYPLVPDYARAPHNYSDKKANGLQRCIKDFMTFNGHHCERINTMGVPIDNRKIVTDVLGFKKQIGSIEWRPSTSTKGSADMQGVINGRIYYFEIKIGRDKQSPDQVKFQQSVELAGAKYFIIKSFDEFIEVYDNIIGAIDGQSAG